MICEECKKRVRKRYIYTHKKYHDGRIKIPYGFVSTDMLYLAGFRVDRKLQQKEQEAIKRGV